jgi:hypothetical protein
VPPTLHVFRKIEKLGSQGEKELRCGWMKVQLTFSSSVKKWMVVTATSLRAMLKSRMTMCWHCYLCRTNTVAHTQLGTHIFIPSITYVESTQAHDYI